MSLDARLQAAFGAVNTHLAALYALGNSGGGQTRRICQIRNAGTPNANPTDWTTLAIGGLVDFTHADFTPAGDGIVCNFDGSVKATTLVKVTASVARGSPNVRFAIAGAEQPPVGASGYIRNSGGHNASSPDIPGFELAVTNGQKVSVQTIREAGAGTAALDIGASYLLLERWA